MFPVQCSCPMARFRYDDLSGVPGGQVGRPSGPWAPAYLQTIGGLADMARKVAETAAQKAQSMREPTLQAQKAAREKGLLDELTPAARTAVKKTFSKSGKLNEIIDRDPAVINARASLEQAVYNFQSTHPMTYTYTKPSSVQRKGYKGTTMTRTTSWQGGRWVGSPEQIERLKRLERAIITASSRYEAARKAVAGRLSQAIPYKGHVIKPVVQNNDVVYKVTFNISKKAGTFASPEEAKAAIDNEVAFGPGGVAAKEAFEQRAQEVGEEQAAREIAHKQEEQEAVGPAQAVESRGLSTGAKVGLAAAAVGGAFLLMR